VSHFAPLPTLLASAGVDVSIAEAGALGVSLRRHPEWLAPLRAMLTGVGPRRGDLDALVAADHDGDQDAALVLGVWWRVAEVVS